MKKQGISLVILVITIIVMIIIATVSIVGINNLLIDANKQNFADDLKTIEDGVEEYYLSYGSLPVKDMAMTCDELVNKLSENKELLKQEITNNKDENNNFYIVDLSKLEMETPKRATTDDELDVFVVATRTLRVYYLKGEKIGNRIYFSGAEFEKNTKIIDDEVNSQIQDVDLKNSIKLSKSTDTWTNILTINLEYILNDNEEMYYKIGDAQEKQVVKKQITLDSTNVTSTTSDLKFTAIRKKSDDILETKEISISNLDVKSPVIQKVELDYSNSEYNTIKFNVTDDISGVKAVIFDYVTVLNADMKTSNYYLVLTDITKEYLLSKGKTSYANSINIDKNIKSLKYMIIDNAYNTTDVYEYTIDNQYLVGK